MRPKGLGLVPHFDPRNLNYLISDVVPVSQSERKAAILASRSPGAESGNAVADVGRGPATSKYHWDSAWWGDQGDTSMCTAFALTHAMADGPVTHRGQNPLADPRATYAEIQSIDKAEGRDYGPDGGATSLAMAKCAMRRGWIGEYRWGYSLADFLAGIKVGPVLLGVNWYSGMDWPDKKRGVIRANGFVRGGHEIVANGVDLDDGLVRLKNSWGRQYGRGGHAYLPFEDLERLIAEDGDVLLFREMPSAKRVAA